VVFAPADFSAATLDAAYALAAAAQVDTTAPSPKPDNPLLGLRAKGFEVQGTGLEPRSNRLFVGLKSLPKERLGELESAWDGYAARGSLPPRATVNFWQIGANVPQETRYESPVTMKGGLELHDNNNHGCTSNVSATGGVVLTASHCFGPNTNVFHSFHNVASGLAYDGYFNGSKADAEALILRTPRMASRFMFAAFGCNGNMDTCQQIDKATGVNNGAYAGGERVCVGGVNTYWIVCGVVQLTTYAPTYTGDNSWRGTVTFNEQVVADYLAHSGTSGGVVGLGGTVHGVHSGSVGEQTCVTCNVGASSTSSSAAIPTTPQTGWGIFSKMVNATAAMNRSVVTSRTWLGISSAYAAGKCADVSNNLINNGTPVWSWPCDGGTAQRWQLEPYGTYTSTEDIWWTIHRYDATSKCADIDTNFGDGAKLQEWDCNNTSAQIFRFDKYGGNWSSGGSNPETFRMISMRTNKCVDLDISAGGTQNGAKIQQYQCLSATQSNQYWRSY
jgi:hypothetical protein